MNERHETNIEKATNEAVFNNYADWLAIGSVFFSCGWGNKAVKCVFPKDEDFKKRFVI